MAAGAGFKTWATGDVLSATDVNEYLMQGVWVFADSSARSTAVTSPQEGNMSFLKDTNSLEYYDGSAWVAVGGGGGASFAGASAYDASNQTVTQYVSTAVTWTSEDFDTDAFHDTSTNTSRMTIPAGKGGYYAITGTLGFQSGGGGRAELFIRKNNVNHVAIRIANSEDPAINISEIMSLAAGDYVELFGFTESSSVTLKKGVYGHFSIAYLGA